ncbi:unnamed protein product [Larinioides sclopetarius]|uniref:Cytochrome P450 n=1 Tax=Larinioides sclopetarius TaxID=280406 RepID=A0AAV2BCC8_9ARAC
MMKHIETVKEYMDWYGFQKILSISLIICIVYKFLIYTKDFLPKFSIFETCSLPSIKGNAPLFYISTIFSLYKQSTPNLPAMCLALQALFGFCQVYGKNGLFTFKLLFKPVVVFFKPETVEAILSSSEHIEKSREYRLLRPWIGTGLITRIEKAVMYRTLCPWLYPDIIFYSTPMGRQFKANLQLVHGLNKKVLKQKIELTKCIRTDASAKDTENQTVEAKVRKPFLELLLEYHLKDPSFTEQDIKEHVDTIMFGGHETTATVMSWVLYCLGIYAEAQQEVHEELDIIFENERNEYISRAVLAKMKYLECVIKETLRLYPVVPFITRENNRPFKVLDQDVSQGSMCFVFISALHRDPVSFPDPEKFDPNRFLAENSTGRHPYAYTPFSAGPRNCVGQKFGMMEAKTILACVLRRFRVISLDPRDKVLTYANIIIRNVHPLRLRFVPR